MYFGPPLHSEHLSRITVNLQPVPMSYGPQVSHCNYILWQCKHTRCNLCFYVRKSCVEYESGGNGYSVRVLIATLHDLVLFNHYFTSVVKHTIAPHKDSIIIHLWNIMLLKVICNVDLDTTVNPFGHCN